MAVDICTESSSPFSSPRVSFSDEPRESDDNIVAVDFNFCIIQNLSQPISSADELFADGKILPLRIKKIQAHHQSDPIQFHSNKSRKNPAPPNNRKIETSTENTKKKRLIEFLSTSVDADEQEDHNKPFTRFFWQFRRSSSLNCENGRSISNGRLLRSLHFLTRSNSTGSAPNPNPKQNLMQKQHSMKESSNSRSNLSFSPSIQYYHYNYSAAERPYLKKSNIRSHGNGVRISPVLNIPPTYNIAKGTAGLFGIGSFFCSKKSKKKKKK